MGNWKLNGTKASVEALIKGLTPAAAAHPSVQVAVCPPVIFLGLVEQLTAGSKIAYGAQNADVHESGAFTGENAPSMLKAFGCTYSLVGHSERRTLHAETDDVVAAKYEAIQKGGARTYGCRQDDLLRADDVLHRNSLCHGNHRQMQAEPYDRGCQSL
jgi:triosephosphate isomerase